MRSNVLIQCVCMLLSGWMAIAGSLAAQETSSDIVVYGGTSGGVVAAIQARRMNKTVTLIEPTKFVGGLTTGGLGATDIGNKRCIGGISREFYERIFDHYNDAKNWRQETRDAYFKSRTRSTETEKAMWTFEPSVATKVYTQMLADAKIEVVFGERLDLKRGVIKDGTAIKKIVMESGRTFAGKVFIDATYEGDLMAKGRCELSRRQRSQQLVRRNDQRSANGRSCSPSVHEASRSVSQGRRSQQRFVARRLASSNWERWRRRPSHPSLQLPHAVPLTPLRIAARGPSPTTTTNCFSNCYLRNFEAGDMRHPWNPVWMPNRKTDTNNNFAISTDNIGMNYDYPEADYATREKIWKEHESYQKGLMWTIANNPRVPESIRKEFNRIAPRQRRVLGQR